MENTGKHPAVSIITYVLVSSLYRGQWMVLDLPDSFSVSACSCSGTPCGPTVFHLPASHLAIWLITLAHMPDISSLSPEKLKIMFFFCSPHVAYIEKICGHQPYHPLDDGFQTLVHGAPVRTSNNPQDHFDSVFSLAN